MRPNNQYPVIVRVATEYRSGPEAPSMLDSASRRPPIALAVSSTRDEPTVIN